MKLKLSAPTTHRRAAESCRSVSCLNGISTGLSSSSKVSITFLIRSRVGAFSQSHWEQVVGCSHLQFCWRIYRISDPTHLPLLFPLLPHQGVCFKPAEKTASLTQCQRAAPWVATLASTLPQHVAAVHMTLFLVFWVLFFRLSLIYELVFRHICLWYLMGTVNANSNFFSIDCFILDPYSKKGQDRNFNCLTLSTTIFT